MLQLEHFDAVRFIAIDPMHNFFLGTPKNVFKLWIKKISYQKKSLKVLEDKINYLDVRTGMGRLTPE